MPWIGFSNWPISLDEHAAFEGSDGFPVSYSRSYSYIYCVDV